jgi:hypothetical protein
VFRCLSGVSCVGSHMFGRTNHQYRLHRSRRCALFGASIFETDGSLALATKRGACKKGKSKACLPLTSLAALAQVISAGRLALGVASRDELVSSAWRVVASCWPGTSLPGRSATLQWLASIPVGKSSCLQARRISHAQHHAGELLVLQEGVDFHFDLLRRRPSQRLHSTTLPSARNRFQQL